MNDINGKPTSLDAVIRRLEALEQDFAKVRDHNSKVDAHNARVDKYNSENTDFEGDRDNTTPGDDSQGDSNAQTNESTAAVLD